MKLRVMSDLHFEHHADGGRSFVDSLDPSGCDALVVAGDLCSSQELCVSITMLCEKFPHVILVPGNHEHYKGDRSKVNTAVRKAAARNSNLSVLDRDVLHFGGKRIIGATLWFSDTPVARRLYRVWSDFACIPAFYKWVWEENLKSVTFLRREMQEGDVVITHYLPSFRSVHPKFAHLPTNCFYVCNVEQSILERKPSLWIHGHTHESFDYRVGSTRVVCNPFGYARLDLNPRFDESLTVEV